MQQKSELPEGWAECQMSDISNVIGGGTPKTSEPSFFTENGISWITPADLSEYTEMYISNGKRSLSESGLKSCSAKLMPAGTVLMSSRAPIGYIAIASNPICTNQGFKSFVCSDGILPEYVYFWLKFKKPLIESMGSGSTFKEVSGSRAKTIPIQIPPTLEQQRIVSAIEALFARLDATNEKLDRVPEILKKFRQSVLAAACEGGLTEDWRKANPDVKVAKELVESIIHEKKMQSGRRKASLNNDSDESIIQNIPESWFESNLDKISIKITDGTHHSPPNGPEGDFKYITAKNIKNNGIDLKNVTFVSSEIHDGICSRCNPEYGDLLLIKDGATTGIVTLNNLTEPFSMLSSVALLKFPENISNKYIMYCMRSPDFQSNVLDKMGGAAITRLTLKKISNMIVALPPLPEQQEIVRRVDALFSFADSIEAKVTAAREKTEKLRQSILAKAFSGELVETEAEIARRGGREYETAEVLIERIKEERRKGGKKL